MVADGSEPLLRWIPFLPLLAVGLQAVRIGVVRRATSARLSAVLATLALTGSFAIAMVCFFRMVALPAEVPALADVVTTWIGTGVGAERFTATLGLRFDPLSGFLVLFISGLSLCIHGFSVVSQQSDRGGSRFYAALGFFTGGALIFALADNLILLFFGWQVASLGQAALSAQVYEERDGTRGAAMALAIHRAGDFAFLLGALLGLAALAKIGEGTLDLRGFVRALVASRDALPELGWGGGRIARADVVAACFALATVSRCVPWVIARQATRAPLEVVGFVFAGVSSLLGVVLWVRFAPLLAETGGLHALLLWTGTLGAFASSWMAWAQLDLSERLLRTAASQRGFVLAALGCAAPVAALFHIVVMTGVHSLLFLCAHRVAALRDRGLDLTRAPGLGPSYWKLHLVFAVGALALAGVPPLAGFFSRSEVLVSLAEASVFGSDWALWILIATSAGVSYITIAAWLTLFWRKQGAVYPGLSESRDEFERWQAAPLWALATFVVFGGLLGVPQAIGDLSALQMADSHSLENLLAPLLSPERPTASSETVYGISFVLLVAASLGACLAQRRVMSTPAFIARIDPSIARLRTGLQWGPLVLARARSSSRWAAGYAASAFERLDRAVFGHRRVAWAGSWLLRRALGPMHSGRLPLALAVSLAATLAFLWGWRP